MMAAEYYCPKCGRNHKYNSDVGQKHLKYRSKLKERIRGKMESMVKSKKWLSLYSTLEGHVAMLQKLYGKAPKLDRSMSMKDLENLYTEIHEDKYGHL